MELVIIVPSLDLTGPVKGAFAICNLMKNHMKVTLISLKGKKNISSLLIDKINIISLREKNFIRKIFFINRYCTRKKNVKALSICLSADIVNIFLNPKIIKFSSIRGNLFMNYSEYPIAGNLIALFHYLIQTFFDYSIVMNRKMYNQVKMFSRKKPTLIYNFIDESHLDKFFKPKIIKSQRATFIFIGRLIERKGIMELIDAFSKVLSVKNAYLHILGDGPLRTPIKKAISKMGIESNISMHGFIDSPYEILSNADVFVLPSYSEGTPRSCLEALYLGIPSILRDVDGNKELKCGENISLFDDDSKLPDLMLQKASQSRSREFRKNLLPNKFSRENNLALYLKLFKN
ncbi:glycosyltransferase [uncultured Prochlorococcus sp.]|uniref:glycosyltransferase n=1 Tax=uncultured Prochlorococcus sp. TaxID=159733 RepID=UPI00258E58D6|nr:glycosyltransferase [uncultured Prochlorococcus sp.]